MKLVMVSKSEVEFKDEDFLNLKLDTLQDFLNAVAEGSIEVTPLEMRFETEDGQELIGDADEFQGYLQDSIDRMKAGAE